MAVVQPIVVLMLNLVLAAEPHFDTDKADPNPILVQEVIKVCDQIEPNASIIIEGHTDVRGSDSYNLRLSKKRAENVKKLLEKQCQKDVKEIKTVPMGENFPVSKNHDENRRVVIHLIQSTPKVITITETKTCSTASPSSKKELSEWHATGFISNGHYSLDAVQGHGYAEARLERSWSAGVLIEKRLFDSLYLGGGLTFDRQVLLGVGFGF